MQQNFLYRLLLGTKRSFQNFMLELLSNVQSQDVVVRLSDPGRAGLILPSEQEKDTDLTMLLMPLLIAN